MDSQNTGHARPSDGLVLFGSGILGSAVREVFEQNGWPVVQYGRQQKDFCNAIPSFEDILVSHPNSKLVINAAAATNVDRCENCYVDAFVTNGSAVGQLGESCKKLNKRLIHISTNHVFDGYKQNPYTESDPVGPVNAYGQTKLGGELLLLCRTGLDAHIVRTGELYNYKLEKGIVHDFIKMVTDVGQKYMIVDQLISPTCAYHLAKQLLVIALKCYEYKLPRIIHATCNGQTTALELAEFIKQRLGGQATLLPVMMKDASVVLGQLAKRPRNGILENKILRNAHLDVMPNWDKAEFFKNW